MSDINDTPVPRKPFTAQPAELLSIAPAIMEGKPVVVVTVRMTEGSFRPTNIALPRDGAMRLLEELGVAFHTSDVLKIKADTFTEPPTAGTEPPTRRPHRGK
jgi:hypothetical protein